MSDLTKDIAKNYHFDDASFGDYFSLLKPRVMSLVVFTAFSGMMVAPNNVHPVIGLIAIIFIALGAGASGALNMWWDADIDAQMKRTLNRPIPRQVIAPKAALQFGLWLAVFAVMMMALAANFAAAALLAFTIFFYVVIYTMYLKRRTAQNIVIGGAAGAFPPVIGWLVSTDIITIEPILMFAVIFLWTPPHFWALALFVKSDYADAGVPMLTVTKGTKATRLKIFLYTLALGICSILLALSKIGGVFMVGVSVLLNVVLILLAYRVWQRNTPEAEKDLFCVEKSLFRHSLLYLFVLFGALIIQSILNRYAFDGWL